MVEEKYLVGNLTKVVDLLQSIKSLNTGSFTSKRILRYNKAMVSRLSELINTNPS